MQSGDEFSYVVSERQELQQRLLPHEEESIQQSTYQPVIDAGDQYLWGLIPLAPESFAIASITFQISSVVCFMSSLYSSPRGLDDPLVANILLFSYYYIALCWVVVPIWQNYDLRRRVSGDHVDLSRGCICGRLIYLAFEVCIGRYEIVSKVDYDASSNASTVASASPLISPIATTNKTYIDRHSTATAATGESESHLRMSSTDYMTSITGVVSNEVTSLQGNRDASRSSVTVEVTRYLPFSLYNWIFMWHNPGRQLNTSLPTDEHLLKEFGFGRSLLLTLSINALGALNSYIFVYAFLELNSSATNPISSTLAYVSALTAVIGYQVN